MLSATDMRNAIIPYRNSTYMLALVADQNPGNPAKCILVQFFRERPLHLSGHRRAEHEEEIFRVSVL